MLLNLILLVVIIFLLFLLSMVWPPDSPWSPWWRTSKRVAKRALSLVNLSDKDIIYELGSGEGIVLITAAKEFGAMGVGIEIDPLRFYISKFLVWKNGLGKKIKLKRGNFFEADISSASVVFVYLVPKAINKLLPKFKKELKKGTKIISCKYEIDLPILKEDKKNKIRVYVI
ncbi:MAG: hypothetical protein UU21_C0004G0045 [Candidatus Levybacteria bacterium GW2011_GWA2_40_8]|nr:MAG: hypothetical protein UU21_C0004G0045 [Candidatus Levybacteria bacterium GW2011_GWA2_40_8]